MQDGRSTTEAHADSSRALHFRTRREIEARPAFSRDAIVTRDNYRGIVGAYSLPEADRVPCQLLRKHERCNTPHGDGWVARTSDGLEAYIGGDCAAKYFGQRSAFALDRARANRELAVDDLLARLSAAHADTSIPARAHTVIDEMRRCLAALQHVRERLPYSVAAKLTSMAKTGRADVPIRVRYEEAPEKPGDKPKVSWVPGQADPVQAVGAYDEAPLRALAQRSREVVLAWESRSATRSTPLKALREQVQVLEQLPQLELAAQRLAGARAVFLEPENVIRAAFLAEKDHDQQKIVRMALGGSTPKSRAQDVWREARARISARYGGRDFRAL